MITLAIIVAVIGTILVVWGLESNRSACMFGAALLVAAAPFALVSSHVSESVNIPEEFQRIESYSYVTEAGEIETLDGPYFEKDGAYYTQEVGLTWLVPFGECEYVEVELPESAVDLSSLGAIMNQE